MSGDRAPATTLANALATQRDIVIQETTEISCIPAPTFAEEERAHYVMKRLQGLKSVQTVRDATGNVVCRIDGGETGRALALVAHLDTVFAQDTPLVPQHSAERLSLAGVGDNGVAVAGLLALARAMSDTGWRPPSTLYLVFTVAEESLGNLAGMRAFMEEHGPELRAVIALEGNFLGRVCRTAVGSRRWRITYRGAGGHSWEDFGKASAVHSLAAAVAALSRIRVPAEPRTTFNVGRFQGGSGVNVIAQEASLLLDLRSVSEAALASLEARAHKLFEREACRSGLQVAFEQLGSRPAGSLPAEHPLVGACREPLERRGIAVDEGPASTDANLPLALGIPAVTIGLTSGGGAHTSEEWIDLPPLETGLRVLAETVYGVAYLLAREEREAASSTTAVGQKRTEGG